MDAVSAAPMRGAVFLRRFRLLILLAWMIPPVFGMLFLVLIDMFSMAQILKLLATPLQAVFLPGWLLFSQLWFARLVRPLVTLLDNPDEQAGLRAFACVQAFPRYFWGLFLFYLLLAPASVIVSAEMATDFVASGADWFRIHLVALIVSIIVGLPIFFALFDLFGLVLSRQHQPRPLLSIRTKVFMLGALMPMLVDTMMVQYYWTRTQYFGLDTLAVWIFMQVLAVVGALLFVRSLGRSLQPLEAVVKDAPTLLERRPAIHPRSTDELGVLAGRYQNLLERVYFHNKALRIGHLSLAGEDSAQATADIFERVVSLCQEALHADIAFLLLLDESTQELVGVAQSGAVYRAEGYYRIPLDAQSIAVFVFQQNELVAIDDVQGDPRVSPEMAAKFGIRATIAVPLRVDDRVIGVLMGANQQATHHYTAEECALTEVLAREAASVAHTLQLQAQRREAEAQALKAEEFARATLQSIADGVVTTDTLGRVEYLNEAAESLTGWERSAACGRPLEQVLQLVDTDSGEPLPSPVAQCLQSGEGLALPGPLQLLSRDGSRVFSVDVRMSVLRDARRGAQGVVLVFHDTTELAALTRRLSYRASHDSLTGLLNRHAFETRLQQALDSTRQRDVSHALCFMDLDRFKIINDTCGHVAGDELLKQLAARMQELIRETDTLARLGGDEFGLLLEDCPLSQAQEVAGKLRQLVADFRFAWADKVFDVGISIGLVPIDRRCRNIADALSAADAACYAAKDRGRNVVHVLEPDDLALLHQRGEMHWLQIIQQALENDDFVLYQQTIRPLTVAASAAGEGYYRSEILLRLRLENGDIVSPDSFLSAAERYHLMPQVDRWVVSRALACLRENERRGIAMNISINLSGQTLCDEKFAAFVILAIQDSGVSPQRLCFEVTETAAIANFNQAVELISELKRMGCLFSLDDFGSGLSSFNYLKNLPVDYLKIDGCFVKDMDCNPIDRAMVEAINEIGHLMGIQTVAEFVTRRSVLTVLDEIGVDFAQGFYVATPQPMQLGEPAAAMTE